MLSFPRDQIESHHQLYYLVGHHNEPKDLAVCTKNAWKNYGHRCKSITVLHDINVRVPRGMIYGLLGPSGCGKTTLLRCIVGRLDLNRGEILVFDKPPGSRGHEIPGRSVGFMPQETALYKNFTISEMLHHFGRLHNMNRKDILVREEFLISFLDLPSKSKNVSQLSGGQQRRVSLACALLQQPRLLILDEPTVGVDPLLREKIWTHLINISKTSKTTIIITTHYIEEARKADRVGLMRNGRMLAEDEPSLLLNKYNQTSLENVFLQLCCQDQNRLQEQMPISTRDGDRDTDVPDDVDDQNLSSTSIHVSINKTNQDCLPFDDQKKQFENNPMLFAKRMASNYLILPKIHKIYALMIKDVTVIKRNIGFLMFQFLIPVIQVALFCLCIGRNPEHIPMAIYNSEAINGFPTGNLSLQLLNKINPDQIHFTSFNQFDKAIDAVKQGHYWGVAAIQYNFTQAIKNKLLAFQTDPTTLNQSSLHLYLDMSNQQLSITIQSVLLNSTELFLKEVLSSYKIDPSIVDPPVIIENPLYGNVVPKFLNFAAPGMMISIIFFLAIGLTALIFVVEKKEGLLERSWIAGVTTIEIMLAHVIVKFFIQIIQIIFLIVFADFIFKVEIKGSIFLSIMLIFVQGICGMSYGLLISSVCEQEIEVMEVAIGSIFPILLSSGVIWPLEGMPSAMRFLSNFTPLTHPVEAMRCIASRGWSFGYFKVWFGFVNASAWSLGFFIIAAVLFALRKSIMDDVTIEDDLELSQDLSSQTKSQHNFLKSFSIVEILTQPWTILLLLSMVVVVFIYVKRNQRRNRNLLGARDYIRHDNSGENLSHNQYDDMERIRQKQQKAYEEQALRHLEQKKIKMENMKPRTDETSSRLKYRSNDHNPLTGQSNRGSGDSCSWRPSSSRRKPAGG
ncbi:unnamed protein product [Rotaria socialis]|uniref:Uncharacterized protein n=1 Tax=Rotaria socialis TaxID=392032 RepID=A0A821DRT7_9BILA|nr:unnamed protein product [Rotaria socialis]